MRVALFIDGNYLIRNVKELLGEDIRMDWNRVRDALTGLAPQRTLLRCYFYDAFPALSSPPTSDEQDRYNRKQGFFNALSLLPYFQPRFGYCRYVETIGQKVPIQKKVDVLLATDLLQLSLRQAITDAILVGGDGDFTPAVEIAKTSGTCIHLVHAAICSADLLRTADTRHPLTRTMIEAWKRDISGLVGEKLTQKRKTVVA